MMADNGGTLTAKRKRWLAAMLCLTASWVGGGDAGWAQTLQIPEDMPVLYGEIPEYLLARPRARHRVRIRDGTVVYHEGEGNYSLMDQAKKFVILNQNPRCLKNLVGKRITVEGRTTETVKDYFNLYFLVIDKINCLGYEGQIGPVAMRDPTDAEIRCWKLHKQLPPATQKFMTALQLPKGEFELAAAAPVRPQQSLADLERRLIEVQQQLQVMEKKAAKPPYQGLYSKPAAEWNSTDLSLYMDLQGGG